MKTAKSSVVLFLEEGLGLFIFGGINFLLSSFFCYLLGLSVPALAVFVCVMTTIFFFLGVMIVTMPFLQQKTPTSPSQDTPTINEPDKSNENFPENDDSDDSQ